MKAGILTFHRAVNYGAVLQAYALQRKNEELGGQAEIIDYRCKKIEEEVSPFDGFKKKIGMTSSLKKSCSELLRIAILMPFTRSIFIYRTNAKMKKNKKDF